MKIQSALFLLLSILSTPLWAADHYSQILNLGDMTNQLSQSRYLVTFDIDYLPPTQFRTFEETIDDPDLGPRRTIKNLQIGGSPLIGIKIEVDRIDLNGQKIEHIKSLTNEISNSVQVAPTSFNPFVASISGYIPQVIALPIENQRFLLTIRGSISDSIQIQPLADGRFQFLKRMKPTAENLSLNFSVVDNQSKKFFELAALVPPFREDPTAVQCSAPRGLRPLRDIQIGNQTLRRVEYCLPIANAFERIVLPIHKPVTTAFEKDLLTRMNRDTGELAARPLMRIPDERLSEMNCHGYSLYAIAGNRLGLPEGATWIEGLSPSFGVEGTNPLLTLLKIHFHKIKTYYHFDEAKVLRDPQVRPGDLILFTRGDNNAMHSAVVVQKPNSAELWLEHKLEEGPVVHTPLENIQNLYSYLNMEIYRLN